MDPHAAIDEKAHVARISADRESFVIDPTVFALLALHLFLVDRHRLWACLIATTNQLPYTRAFILSGLAGTCAAWIALRAGWGIYGLILPPFLIQSLYNKRRGSSPHRRSVASATEGVFPFAAHLLPAVSLAPGSFSEGAVSAAD